jgi:phospholipid/cholesterol/gamma-HCH transport system substrate-binding protein
MESKREQVWVGLFVIIAATLLIVTVFTLTGAFAGSAKTFHARFHNVAGLDAGATVRYEGGPKIGRVEKIRIDPNDPSLMDMEFSVKSDVPIKTDSHVAILSFSPLGDNHLEVKAGSPGAPKAAPGAVLQSEPYVGFNDLTAQINKLAPQAQELLKNLNDRVVQLKLTVDRINDLLNDRNRENVSASLADLRGMLAENRPQIRNTLKNVNTASEKIGPLLDQLHKTVEQTQGTLKKVDGLIDDNREDVRASVVKLRQSLENISALTAQLQLMLDNNDENIDQILNNVRIITENLKSFTYTIKTHPSSLVVPSNVHDRKPGDKP